MRLKLVNDISLAEKPLSKSKSKKKSGSKQPSIIVFHPM